MTTLSDLLERVREATTDRLYWAFCFVCYRLVLAWPKRWMPWPILPHAGLYGYSPTYADYLDARAWHRAGRPALIQKEQVDA